MAELTRMTSEMDIDRGMVSGEENEWRGGECKRRVQINLYVLYRCWIWVCSES